MTAGRPLPLSRGNPKQFAVNSTDLHVPWADGFDVLRAARDANPSVYVAVSAFPMAEPGGGEVGAFGGRPGTGDRGPIRPSMSPQ